MASGRARTGWSILALAAIVVALAAAPWIVRSRVAPATTLASHRETLVASIRSEPGSFNRYIARDLSTTVLTYLMHGALVRVNRATNALEPELAESWERLPDQRTYRLRLRPGVRFSDGAPFTAADVVFSFKAIYDPAVDSELADSLRVSDKPLDVTAEDAATVVVRFPSAFGPGLRILDGVPVYPRHRLEAALANGSFKSTWGSSTPPAEIAGLGPFVLDEYVPGQRLRFSRNPHYWQHSRGLPKAAHVVLQIVSNQDAELLQLQTGGIDLTQSELRPADVPALKQAARADRIAIADAGVGLDGDLLWMNLTAAKARDPRSRWLQDPDFRRAIARTVDRRRFVDTVYFGEGVAADSIVSPGNREWHAEAPLPPYDLERARSLFASLGLTRRKGDGALADRDGHDVRFTLLTQKGNTSLERGASAIRDSLAAVGVRVDVVPYDVGTLMHHVTKGDYDAAYFRLLTTDTDPALNLDFWLSSGSAHVWNPGQRAPSTPWEREIDGLMNQVATTLESGRRLELFSEVQRITAREVPALCFAFPRLSIAVNARVVGAAPAPFRPTLLWNAAGIGVSR
jgi:peptide/nickel transport system substrate-binding protein